MNKNNPNNFHDWYKLTTVINTHNTRSKFININNLVTTRTLFIPIARTSKYGLKLLKVLGPKIWNSLPPLLRINESLDNFIKKIKINLINDYIETWYVICYFANFLRNYCPWVVFSGRHVCAWNWYAESWDYPHHLQPLSYFFQLQPSVEWLGQWYPFGI